MCDEVHKKAQLRSLRFSPHGRDTTKEMNARAKSENSIRVPSKKTMIVMTRAKKIEVEESKNAILWKSISPQSHSASAKLNQAASLSKLTNKRSLSLQELTPLRRTVSDKSCAIEKSAKKICKIKFDDRTAVSMEVYSAFLRNAWRKCKARVEEEQVKLAKAESQVGNLKIQVSSLMSFVDSDRALMTNMANDLIKMQDVQAKSKHEYALLQSEKDDLEVTVNKANEEKLSLSLDLDQHKCKCEAALNDALDCQKQLQIEKDKLTSMIFENDKILNKLALLECDNSKMQSQINQLEDTRNNLEAELEAEKAKCTSEESKVAELERLSSAESSKVKELEVEIFKAKATINTMVEHIKATKGKLMEKKSTCQSQRQLIDVQAEAICDLNAKLNALKAPSMKSRFYRACGAAMEIPLYLVTMGPF